MKPCRECKHEISEQAFMCPSCGAPFPGRESRADPSRDRCLLAAGLVLAGAASYFAHQLIQSYGEMFARFGVLTPGASLAGFYPFLLAAPPLLVLAAWRFWPRPTERSLAALVVGGALAFMLPALASAVMSLAILGLGK